MDGPRPVVTVDYTPAAGHAPGVGRYVREWIRADLRIPVTPDDPVLRLVEVGRAPRPMAGAPLGLLGHDVQRPHRHELVRLPRRVIGKLGSLGARLVARRSQLLHRTHVAWPPAGRTPISLAVAEFPPPRTRADDAFAREVSQARGILAFSSEAARRLRENYHVPDARVHRVTVGSEHWERDLPEPGSRRPQRDVLVLGAIRAARRPINVLCAFEALCELGERARLLFVGRASDAAPQFRARLDASPVRNHVRWIADPLEERMPECVAGASVLLHFADDEVSPVTPLEATRMGVPVVATALPAFQEALDGVAHWVDHDDAHAAARALENALAEADDSGTRARLAAHAAPYTWHACALAHRAAWRSMLTGPSPSD